MQRIRGQIRGVQLARREPAQLRGDRGNPHARGVKHRRTGDQRDRRRARGRQSAAAGSIERRLDDPRAFHAHGHSDQVPTERATRGPVEASGKHNAAPHGRGEVFGEALAVHER
jgi:hypothetical protein